MVLRRGRRSPPATSRCSISTSPARARKRKLEAEIARALDKGAEAIVLGCAGWPISRRNCRGNFGVPVVDGVAAAVKQAEALAGLKLTTSRRGSYASPGVKKYDGMLAPFAPKTQARVRTH
jgi:allantoin racemase